MNKAIKVMLVLAIVVIAGVGVVAKLKDNKKQFQQEIAFTEKKIDKIPVTVEDVANGVISENVIATGTLEASDVLNLVSETQGRIVKVFKEKGDYVAAGDVIVKVDDEVISANVLTAEANYAQSQRDFERLTRLAEENAVAKRDLEQAQIGLKKTKAELITAQKALNNTSIKAPINGYINSDNVTLGQLLNQGAGVCEIVNNEFLKLNIKISEKEVYKISKGQNVTIKLSVFPDKNFSGKVSAIAEKADAAMKFNVEITMSNRQAIHLRSGLYAEVELPVKNTERLIINKAAILGSMESPSVFIVQNGKAFKRQIIIGQNNSKQAEVLNGLESLEKVVVSGQLNLKDGDDVAIVN
jgi:RND family efflux transporter MFP subunit